MLNQITAGILALTTWVGGLFGLAPQSKVIELENKVQQLELQLKDFENISLGSYYAVGTKYYKLWGSGIDSDDTSVVLTSFQSPVNNQELTMTNFGEIGYGTIEPENTSNIEFISFSGITQDSGSEKATLTGVNRGLNFVYPYNASTTLGKSHSGGSRFIISNPPMHYGEYTAKRNAESIWGDWTFSATSTPQYNANPDFNSGSKEFASIKYVDDSTTAGGVSASTSTDGYVVIATSEQRKNFSTTTGIDESPLVLRLRDFATSTDKNGATTTAVMTDTDGLLSQSFFDLNEPWTFGSSTTFGTTTHNKSARFNASTTLATTTIGTDASHSLYVNASSTFNTTSTFRNASTTFDRLPLVIDSDDATSTNPYSLAKYGDVIAKGIKFPGTLASTTGSCPCVNADLNLSSIVGANRALVTLRAVKSGGGDAGFTMRTNGVAVVNDFMQASLNNGEAAMFTILTDTAGKIEVWDNDSAGGQTSIYVDAFIK